MRKNRIFVLIMMIWLTILTVWSINKVNASLTFDRPITISGWPEQNQQITAVPMDKNTVWIIDSNDYSYIKVITRDNEGFKITQSFMSLRNE